jgi:hypothetical protein
MIQSEQNNLLVSGLGVIMCKRRCVTKKIQTASLAVPKEVPHASILICLAFHVLFLNF